MSKILIFGNSASGKSTLAKNICKSHEFAHLDLDTLAWEDTLPPKRKSLSQSKIEITNFIENNRSWVIEGCYTDLLVFAEPHSSEIIFMNLTIEACISNAKKRPWEPHKYESKELQDKNLDMLIDWIAQYNVRNDTFSFKSHEKFYNNYAGEKSVIDSNQDAV